MKNTITVTHKGQTISILVAEQDRMCGTDFEQVAAIVQSVNHQQVITAVVKMYEINGSLESCQYMLNYSLTGKLLEEVEDNDEEDDEDWARSF